MVQIGYLISILFKSPGSNTATATLGIIRDLLSLEFGC